MNTTTPTPQSIELDKMRAYASRWHNSQIQPLTDSPTGSWVMKAQDIDSRAPTFVFTNFLHLRAWLKEDQQRRIRQRYTQLTMSGIYHEA